MIPATTAPQKDDLRPREDPTRDQRAGKPPLLDVALFLYLPFLLSVSRAFASTTDDPFITLRYAANLVHGLGVVFNPGQHVQGYTSPLHLVVATLLYLVPGGHDLLKLKLTSLIFGLFAVREAGLLLYGIDIPRWARRTGCVAVSTSWIVAYASSNGLETTLAMWLLMSLARRLVVDGPRQFPLILGFLAFAAVLARPDALLVLAFMGAVGLIIERPLPMRPRVSWIVGAALAAASTAGIGLIYFKDALPNTYYAKDVALGQALSRGSTYLITALQPQSGAGDGTVLVMLQLALLAAGVYVVIRRFHRCGYLVAIVVAQTLFILKSGGDWMHGDRFAAPAAIPMILVQLLGLVYVVSAVGRRARYVFTKAVGVIAAAGLIASSISLDPLPAPVWHLRGSDDQSLLAVGGYPTSHLWVTLPSYLQCLHAGQLVATSEVGYLGFARQDLRVLDIRGLTDRTIAKGAPASLKFPWGVDDPSLLQSTSPVGRILLHAKPAVIATFDAEQGSALNGQYTFVKVPPSLGTSIYVRSSSNVTCPKQYKGSRR